MPSEKNPSQPAAPVNIPASSKPGEFLDASAVNPKATDIPRKNTRGWQDVRQRASTIAKISTLFVGLILFGAAGSFVYFQSRQKPASPTASPKVANLTAEELNQLGQASSDLGASGQTLNIAADALFRGKASVTGGLTVGGSLATNGSATVASLGVSGGTNITTLSTTSGVTIGGSTTIQKSLSVADLTSVNNLNASGVASVNSLNASTIAVRNLSISGPLTISHLISSGPAPGIVAGSVGGGGTVSISGNDTTGTVNINTGSSPGNLLATITFRSAYGTGVHVQLSPLSDAAATAGAYVTRTSGGFQVHAHGAASGAVLSFDYLVVQ